MLMYGIINKVINQAGNKYILEINHNGQISLIEGVCLLQLKQGLNIEYSINEESQNIPFGDVLKVKAITVTLPITSSGIYRYLANGEIPGIGIKTANKLIEYFGENIVEVLNDTPERIYELNLGQLRSAKIIETWKSFRYKKKVLENLGNLGFGPKHSHQIYKQYKHEALEVINQNPYQLLKDIPTMGFHAVDKVALAMGYSVDTDIRIECGIIQALKSNELFGKIHLKLDNLKKALIEILNLENIQNVAILAILDKLEIQQLIKINSDKICLYSAYLAATVIVEKVELINKQKEYNKKLVVDLTNNSYLTQLQKKAIKYVFENTITIVSGAKSTGKTKVIKSIAYELNKNSLSYTIIAPNKQLAILNQQLINLPITVPSKDLKKLVSDYVIIDDASLLDIYTFANILKEISLGASLILLGDENLILGGKPGYFQTLVHSGCFPTFNLTERIDNSKLAMSLHMILEGAAPFYLPNTTEKIKSGCEFITYTYNKDNPEHQNQLIMNDLVNLYFSDLVNDVQILTGSKNGEFGADNINRIIQERLINRGKLSDSGDIARKNSKVTFRVNDKIVQLCDNDESNVKTGEIGVIQEIRKDGILIIQFLDKNVIYTTINYGEIDLAYAITIHMGAASKFNTVVIPMVSQEVKYWHRFLLYTGMSRAIYKLFLIGHIGAMLTAKNSVRKSEIDEGLINLLNR